MERIVQGQTTQSGTDSGDLSMLINLYAASAVATPSATKQDHPQADEADIDLRTSSFHSDLALQIIKGTIPELSTNHTALFDQLQQKYTELSSVLTAIAIDSKIDKHSILTKLPHSQQLSTVKLFPTDFSPEVELEFKPSRVGLLKKMLLAQSAGTFTITYTSEKLQRKQYQFQLTRNALGNFRTDQPKDIANAVTKIINEVYDNFFNSAHASHYDFHLKFVLNLVKEIDKMIAIPSLSSAIVKALKEGSFKYLRQAHQEVTAYHATAIDRVEEFVNSANQQLTELIATWHSSSEDVAAKERNFQLALAQLDVMYQEYLEKKEADLQIEFEELVQIMESKHAQKLAALKSQQKQELANTRKDLRTALAEERKELAELQQELNQINQEKAKLRTEILDAKLSPAVAIDFYSALRKHFTDYDPAGRTDDVNITTLTEQANRLEKISRNNNCLLDQEDLLGLLECIVDRVASRYPGNKFKLSTIKKIIGLVEHCSSRVAPDELPSLKNSIDNMQLLNNRRHHKLDDVESFIKGIYR